MNTTSSPTLIAVILALSCPSTAYCLDPDELRIRVRVVSEFEDSDTSHDDYTYSSPTAYKYRGGRVRVTVDSTVVYGASKDYLNEFAETPDLTVGIGCHDFDVRIWSEGEVWGNEIRALNSAGNARYKTAYGVTLCSGLVYEVTIDPDSDSDEPRFNVAAAALFSAYKGVGGVSGATFDFYTKEGSSGYASGETPRYMTIDTGHWNNKFVIAHEMGHHLADVGTPNVSNGSGITGSLNYTMGNDNWPNEACVSTHGHAMWSREVDRSAAAEGFAHFYAAHAWNYNTQTNCYVTYYKSPYALAEINCEGAGTGESCTTSADCRNGISCSSGKCQDWPTKFNRTLCSSPWEERGVELDWLRQFWDVHTEGTVPPTLEDMLDWFDEAGGFGHEDAYDDLNTAANTVGGQLNTNWDNRKCGNNGIADEAHCSY